MAMIELECPQCRELLELDAGFAGGVCRCSHCGTLMTVPSDTDETAERLQRPASPTAPSSSGTRPASPLHSVAATESAEPGQAAESEAAEPGETVEPAETNEPAEPTSITSQTLTTDSGRTVQLDAGTSIPTARRKRPMVRAVTAGAIILVVAALAGLSLYGIYQVVAPGAADDPNQAIIEQFGYDPAANVYTMDTPNVLGLSPRSPVAVVVDASGASRDWLTLVHDAILAGVTGHERGATIELGLIYATEREARMLSDAPEPIGELSPAALRAFQDNVAAAGVAPLGPSLSEALAWEPQHLVLVTGRELEGELADAIEEATAGHPKLTLDIVLMDVRSPAAAALAQRHGGRTVQLSLRQLMRWRRNADANLP